jgi:hypothetical protein
LLFDDWDTHVEAPSGAPDRSGDWPLNPLRWALLRAALKAPHNSRVSARGPALRPAVTEAGLVGPVALAPHHRADAFDCGTELLNGLLRKSVEEVRAGQAPRLTTRVFTSGDRIAAYYSTRPIYAFPEDDPAERIKLMFVARLGIDRQWSGARLTDHFFFEMLRDVWSAPPGERPAALVGLAASPGARRVLRFTGARMLGDALDPRAVMFPAVDIVASIEAGERGLGLIPP